MKKICQLIDCNYDIDVVGVSDDSRKIKDGYLFVATKGFYVDHFDYILNAVENGAVAVVCDRIVNIDVPVILVQNINECYIEICQKFYDVIPDDFSLIGITGTDGKTTTTTIVKQLLNGIVNTALIGTNGAFINDCHLVIDNTTPCISQLYEVLSKAKNGQCKNVVMEVSSEALLHRRLDNFKYSIIGYTNITGDHLNVHKTLDNYISCKLSLLKLLRPNGIAVVNGDDENCKHVKCDNMYTFGFDSDNDYVISDVKQMSKFVKFSITYNDIVYEIDSPFIGLYNVYNVAMAFIICLLYGLDSQYLIEKIRKLKPIDGRGEFLDFGQNYKVILDYAHTFNGIKNILDSVCNYKNIITVTGAAGGREKEKRKNIGKLILEKSDLCIFTMDDPRYEDPNDIIDQMVGERVGNYYRIIDRKLAIEKALSLATKDSVVLILGKGRDNYMAIGDKKVPYCDYDVIKNFYLNK